ncbi:e3 ubiquitin-protein ligase siah2 [Anaeramoeba ignava]|uniref:E3 ubiquitin-protein ligase siah2 n=1 Tax=Anaeramoeba ignava TaxID=1746090 RepID=A0A9Q0LNT1_ANAIG|nr:e3 ubiquitin-protein ligase siah2 [Anaeramoeba ignava]
MEWIYNEDIEDVKPIKDKGPFDAILFGGYVTEIKQDYQDLLEDNGTLLIPLESNRFTKIYNFKCSICFERFDSKRKPIIICSNGHSICEKCVENVKNCPFCRLRLDKSKFITNISLLQLSEEIGERISDVPVIPLEEIMIDPQPFQTGASADIFKAKWGNQRL